MWLSNRSHPGLGVDLRHGKRTLPATDRTEALTDARASIATAVRAGYDTAEQIIEYTLENITEGDTVDDEAELLAKLHAMVREEAAQLREERGTWPDVTDNDRLERAFEALEAVGIVARENFTCCQTCGHAEIGMELREGETARGYTFFHQQDTDTVAGGGALMLAYGPMVQGVESVATIGREVAEALRTAGLTVEWNGDVSKRIGVAMKWQRRENRVLG